MHELSIATNILEIVRQSVPAEDHNNVQSVKIKLGDVSGVIADSLEFSFEAITDNSPFENTKLDIRRIPFLIQCSECMEITTNEYGVRICSACNSTDTELVSGDELLVDSIILNSQIVNWSNSQM
jgi:hydrogenase nickel incorporation protein HypA/HybF